MITGNKYININWKELQDKYDSGCCWRDLIKMGYSNHCIDWAVQNKKLIMRKRSDASKEAWRMGRQKKEKYQTKEFRKKMEKNGGIRENAGRCKSITHISPIAGKVNLNGTWEKKLAIWLDENKILWVRNKKSFPYEFQGKIRKYYPDFYLPDKNQYIEVKGYETDKDRAKWSQFKEPILVLKKKELSSSPYNFWSHSLVA